MKTIAIMSILSGTLLCGVDAAVAQSPRSFRVSPRIIVETPRFEISRPLTPQRVVTYGGFSHIDELGIEMEELSRDILWEMHFNYSHNHEFRETYAEAYDIYRYSQSIHAAEHRGNRREIVRLAGELDELFHHVEDDISNWRPSHRHMHSVRGGSLIDKMEALEQTLHHLMEDVGLGAGEPPASGRNTNPPPPSFIGVRGR